MLNVNEVCLSVKIRSEYYDFRGDEMLFFGFLRNFFGFFVCIVGGMFFK